MNNNKSEHPITIVHTEGGMCLTTKQFGGWREVQGDFEDYKTSLGPFDVDELVDYLRIEYPSRAPFSQDDVRSLTGRSSAYMWAAIESLPEGDGLKFGATDGDSLRLAIVGYQFPEHENRRKRFSWYVVDGSATAGGRAWDFRWQALTCDDAPLVCGWLFEVANWVEAGSGEDESPRPPWLVEPNLQLVDVIWQNGRALLTVELDLEFLPPEFRRGRPRAGNPEVLRIPVTAEDLRRAALEFAETIVRYPVEPGPSRPVSD